VLYEGEVCLGGGVIDRVTVSQPEATRLSGSGASASAT
jgi:hypothetical protein